jgi:hypothetical protein
VDPGVAEAHAQAFRALRALGFREEETHRALALVRADSQVGNANTECVLRAALRVLTDARRVQPGCVERSSRRPGDGAEPQRLTPPFTHFERISRSWGAGTERQPHARSAAASLKSGESKPSVNVS